MHSRRELVAGTGARVRGPLRALALALALAGCGDDSGESETDGQSVTDSDGTGAPGETEAVDEGPWDSFEERTCPPDSPLDAQNFGVPFFLTHCTGCHSATIPAEDRQGSPVDVNFDSVDEILAQADRVWARSADQNNTMPPIDSVAPEERVKLGEWLACGAPLVAE